MVMWESTATKSLIYSPNNSLPFQILLNRFTWTIMNHATKQTGPKTCMGRTKPINNPSAPANSSHAKVLVYRPVANRLSASLNQTFSEEIFPDSLQFFAL